MNLIINIFKNDSYYHKLKRQKMKITDKEGLLIFNRQNLIFKMRNKDNIIYQNYNFFDN